MNVLPILALCLPAAAAPLLFLVQKRMDYRLFLGGIFAAELILTILIAIFGGEASLFTVGGIHFALRADTMGSFFAVLVSFLFLIAGFDGFACLSHEKHLTEYHFFLTATLFSLIGLCYAADLYTYYAFFEFMTFLSFPLVLQERTPDAIFASVKYLGYSLLGAMTALFGIFCVPTFFYSASFTSGGTLNAQAAAENPCLFLAAAFCMLFGFSCKAGLMPLHDWLPTAHPQAPAPASALLSGVITKGGVLGVIRVAYYVCGADALRGTWVQTVFLILSLTTVFCGSMLAYKEKLLKKRLAYSTVSQVSYVLFGLFLFSPAGLTGALLQVVYHALAKGALFLCAGTVIHETGKKYVDEMDGVGISLPITMWVFTFASLSLVGIPPMGGFTSKWYLATASLETSGPLSWIGALVLLTSALLTAGYLFPIVTHAFFPHENHPFEQHNITWYKRGPLLALCCVLIAGSIWTSGLLSVISGLAASLV